MCKLRQTQLAILRRSSHDPEQGEKSISDDLDVVQLKVSQATAVQQFNHRFAVQLKDSATDQPAEQLENALDNDRTNTCAFRRRSTK